MADGLGKLMAMLKPEAAYFFGEHGKRTAFIVFDMQDSSELPSVCEPLFQMLNAEVYLTPAMNLEDLQKGMAAL